MLKRMPYSLFMSYYRSFPADQYDKQTKTVLVELPDVPAVRWPKDWKRSGNHYLTPKGCLIHFWNTGLAQNFYIEHITDGSVRITIHPGINSRKRVLDAVRQIESML